MIQPLSTTSKRTVSFGVGLDMPWGGTPGFRKENDTETPDASTQKFLKKYESNFSHLFLSLQPKNRDKLKSDEYFEAFENFFNAAPNISTRALHHTMLNIAGGPDYDRNSLLTFTNELTDRFNLQWINEDVGIWSLFGKSLPYPLPPILSQRSLEEAIQAVKQIQAGLNVPLLLEFPGFTEGSAIIFGDLGAFDYFRILAEETDSFVTLDTGHILSYQHLCNQIGEKTPSVFDLPLDRCFEVHLAGSEILPSGFRDTHMGVLIPDQFSLLDLFLKNCSKLKAITYEDPKFDAQGQLREDNLNSFEKLLITIKNFNSRLL